VLTTRLNSVFRRLDERRLGADRHLLGNLAEAHRDVGVGRAADRQDDAGLNRGLEARELGAHFVDARLQRREAVAAVGAGGRRAGRARRRVLRRHGRAGERGAGVVADTGQRRRGDLRARVNRQAEQHPDQDRDRDRTRSGVAMVPLD
jgi:hypothetical protein